jgi:hypothetical protein
VVSSFDWVGGGGGGILVTDRRGGKNMELPLNY